MPIAGLKQTVPVLILHDSKAPPEATMFAAPDTRHVEVLAAFDRGSNYHGPLREEFFICNDKGYAPSWTILWVTLDASQEEDSVQRLEPFCMLATGWQTDCIEDEGAPALEDFDNLELERLILLWAYVHYATTSWGEEWLAEAKITAGSLNSRAAHLVLEAGASGEPLNFSVSYKRDSEKHDKPLKARK